MHHIASSASYCDMSERRPFSANYLQALQKQLQLSKATLSRHIGKLLEARLIRSVQHGRVQLLFLDTAGRDQVLSYLGRFAPDTPPPQQQKMFAITDLTHEKIVKILDYIHLHGWKVSGRIMLADPLHARYYLLWQDTPLLRLHFDLSTHHLTVTELSSEAIQTEKINAALDLIKKIAHS